MGETSMIKIGPGPKGTIETNDWDNLRTQVLKVFISHGDKIYGIQFQYFENEALVLGDIHGDFTGPNFNILNLNFPSEYLTGIRGSRGTYTYLKSLAFQTNLRLHGPFGDSPGKGDPEFCFDLGEERRHLGGFHGNVSHSNNISAIGIYLKPVMEVVPYDNDNDNNVENTENVKVED